MTASAHDGLYLMRPDPLLAGRIVRPLLRWAGSKKKLLPRLTPFAGHRTGKYIEPFVGSAALFFSVAPQHAVLGDANSELIETYREIVRDPVTVHAIAAGHVVSRDRYLEVRALDPRLLLPVERAARFIFLNRNCFNGLYRTNLRGGFNVPFAPAKSGALPSVAEFQAAARLLARATLVNADFGEVIRRHVGPGDFVYMDPPYAVENRRIFRQYTAHTFGFDDLARLSDLLHAIDAMGATFLVSYAYSPEAIGLLTGWRTHKVFTQRNISGFSEFRRSAAEVLVTNIDL